MWKSEDNFSRDERKLVATDFHTRGLWFVKFIRGERLSMGIIRNQDFGILALTMVALQITWDPEWEDGEKLAREKIVEMAASVLIGFCGGLRGEKNYLDFLGRYASDLGRNQDPPQDRACDGDTAGNFQRINRRKVAHAFASLQDLVRFRSEELRWEMVECVGGRRSKGRGMGVSRYTRGEKYGDVYR